MIALNKNWFQRIIIMHCRTNLIFPSFLIVSMFCYSKCFVIVVNIFTIFLQFFVLLYSFLFHFPFILYALLVSWDIRQANNTQHTFCNLGCGKCSGKTWNKGVFFHRGVGNEISHCMWVLCVPQKPLHKKWGSRMVFMW